MKKKMTLKEFVCLQAVVMLYTMAAVIGKFAAGQTGYGFLLLYCAEVGVLGIYALLWQQILKRFELSTAYANRALALVWSLLWAVLIFNERVTARKLLGIALVAVGAFLVNREGGTQENA